MTPVFVHDIIAEIEKAAPFSLAAEWDNVGLVVGDGGQEATGVLVGLDPLPDLFGQARRHGANVIITHHPAIFSPLKRLHTGDPVGAFVAGAVQGGFAVIACHTNLDVVANGVSAVLAGRLGATALQPLAATGVHADGDVGFGMVGALTAPVAARDFLARVCRVLGLTGVPHTTPPPERVARIAVCGGSGSDLVEAALRAGVDAYITGEIKHSTARWAQAAGLWLIDAGHFATEQPAMEVFAGGLAARLSAAGMDIAVHAAAQRNPFSLFVPEKTDENKGAPPSEYF